MSPLVKLVFGVDDIPCRAFPFLADKQLFGHSDCLLLGPLLRWHTGAISPVSRMTDFGIDVDVGESFSAAKFFEVELAIVVKISEIHQVGPRSCRRGLTIHEELLTHGMVSMQNTLVTRPIFSFQCW